MRLAAIDIGSNAARLLISDVVRNGEGKPDFNKLNLVRVPLRLGFDVFEKKEISVRNRPQHRLFDLKADDVPLRGNGNSLNLRQNGRFKSTESLCQFFDRAVRYLLPDQLARRRYAKEQPPTLSIGECA